MGEKLTDVKKATRKIFTTMTEIEMLKHLHNFTTEDIKELMDETENGQLDKNGTEKKN